MNEVDLIFVRAKIRAIRAEFNRKGFVEDYDAKDLVEIAEELLEEVEERSGMMHKKDREIAELNALIARLYENRGCGCCDTTSDADYKRAEEIRDKFRGVNQDIQKS